MKINGAEAIAKASQAIKPGETLGVWFDFKTHMLITTEERTSLEDKSHTYAIGQIVKPMTPERVMKMMHEWMHW